MNESAHHSSATSRRWITGEKQLIAAWAILVALSGVLLLTIRSKPPEGPVSLGSDEMLFMEPGVKLGVLGGFAFITANVLVAVRIFRDSLGVWGYMWRGFLLFTVSALLCDVAFVVFVRSRGERTGGALDAIPVLALIVAAPWVLAFLVFRVLRRRRAEAT